MIRKETSSFIFFLLFLLALLLLSMSGVIEGNTNAPSETPAVTPTSTSNGPKIYQSYQIDNGYSSDPSLQPNGMVDKADKTIHWFPYQMNESFNVADLKDANGKVIMVNNNTYFRDCKNLCRDTPNCEGIVTDYPVGFGPGGCYLKTEIRGGEPAQGSAGMFYRIARNQHREAPPDVVAMGPDSTPSQTLAA